MKIPIRTLGIVTLILWAFLALFAVSAVYSIKDIQFILGEAQANVTAENEAVLSLPLTIVNKGYYDLDSFSFSTRVMDAFGSTIVQGYTFVPVIRTKEKVDVTQEIRLNITDLLEKHEGLLFNDTELIVNEAFGMTAFEVIPVQASTNVSVFWGAPLHGLWVGEPELAGLAAAEPAGLKVLVPFSFDNHAFFDLDGQLLFRIYNSANMLVGEGETTVNAPQHSSYYGKVELRLSPDRITRKGHLEVFFQSSLFTLGPLVFPYDV